VQASFVAAGLGVITMPGTALRSLDLHALHANRLPDLRRRVWAVTTPQSTDIVTDFVASMRSVIVDLGLADSAPEGSFENRR
jgi:DNA-binding transcriptional LysR family regulator